MSAECKSLEPFRNLYFSKILCSVLYRPVSVIFRWAEGEHWENTLKGGQLPILFLWFCSDVWWPILVSHTDLTPTHGIFLWVWRTHSSLELNCQPIKKARLRIMLPYCFPSFHMSSKELSELSAVVSHLLFWNIFIFIIHNLESEMSPEY